MSTRAPWSEDLTNFLQWSRFAERGGLVTGLDGMAAPRGAGRVRLLPALGHALRTVHDRGRPVIVQTPRPPLSVMALLAGDSRRLAASPLPLVALQGSLVGHVVARDDGSPGFDELAAWPLAGDEIDELMAGVQGLVDDGVGDLLLRFCPRDWRLGESVWTPDPRRVPWLRQRHREAREVFACGVAELHERLGAQPVCLLHLRIDDDADRSADDITGRGDRRHAPGAGRPRSPDAARSSVHVHAGVSGRQGVALLARQHGVDVAQSIGVGSSVLDDFLGDVGFAIHLGRRSALPDGVWHTTRVADPPELGALLRRLGRVRPALHRHLQAHD